MRSKIYFMKSFLFILIIPFILSCNGDRVIKTERIPDKDMYESTPSIDPIIFKKRHDSLIKFFNVKKDEFKDASFYINKRFHYWPDRTCLYSYFNSQGDLFLVSNFYSSDWIFHTSATILINGEKLETNKVETFSEWNKTQNSGGDIWENVSYTSEKEIIELIGLKKKNQIKVRLNGQYSHDFIMSSDDKEAFAQTWALYRVMFPAK